MISIGFYSQNLETPKKYDVDVARCRNFNLFFRSINISRSPQRAKY